MALLLGWVLVVPLSVDIDQMERGWDVHPVQSEAPWEYTHLPYESADEDGDLTRLCAALGELGLVPDQFCPGVMLWDRVLSDDHVRLVCRAVELVNLR